MKFPRKIYAITHNVTKRTYIGSSCRVEARIGSHLSRLRCHKHHIGDMQADYDKYGELYSIEVIDEISCYDERHKEYEWMERFKSRIRGIGYNYLDKEGTSTKTSVLIFTFKGETLSLSQWASKVGVPYNILYGRIFQRKWDIGKALSTPIRK